ncbi:glycosyltransferase [Paenibacillus glycanilyticus]|uniref:glycosyltransferase n=1 Tax=Paenibacillus glycanilyticus TaxID=126569 RepID=UPI00203F721E|nr:glycosyltransferase [Paenibacillus glycanilyticus]MCM3627952.1 glycosyltransferase [Paenibacillus glycanilyticus]
MTRLPVTCSIIVPVCNDEEALFGAYKRLKHIMKPAAISYEFIFVDNHSTDRSAEMLRVFCAADIRVRVIYLSARASHAAAIAAGIDHAVGSGIAVMEVKPIDRKADMAELSNPHKSYAIRMMEGFTHSPLWDSVPAG